METSADFINCTVKLECPKPEESSLDVDGDETLVEPKAEEQHTDCDGFTEELRLGALKSEKEVKKEVTDPTEFIEVKMESQSDDELITVEDYKEESSEPLKKELNRVRISKLRYAIVNENRCCKCHLYFSTSERRESHDCQPDAEVTERSLVCGDCGKRSTKKSDLVKHQQRVHLGIREFACGICGREFATRRDLEYHNTGVHALGPKPYQCELCACAYLRKHQLDKHHKLAHLDVKAYKCSVCSRSFGFKSHLESHISSVHFKLKPYSCDVCQKMFSLKQSYKRHYSAIHEKLTPYTCPECGKAFPYHQSLVSHLKLVHVMRTSVRAQLTM